MVIAANFRKPNCFFFHYNSVTIWKKGTFSEILFILRSSGMCYSRKLSVESIIKRELRRNSCPFLSNSIESLNLNASYT